MIASLLSASIGVPYFVAQQSGDAGGSAAGSGGSGGLWPFATASADAGDAAERALAPPETLRLPIDSPGSLLYGNPTSLEGAQIHSIEQVLRFDVTKAWVYRNWSRKSTGLADGSLVGVRVPLVTGTRTTDLAGSLTYYFNSQGQVEYISFRGRTGDAAQLVAFLQRTYEFKPQQAPVGEQLWQVTRSGRLQSELRTRPEPVLWSTSPHTSYAVELELVRPGLNRYLSPRGPQLQVPPAAPRAPIAQGAPAAGDGGGLTDKAEQAVGEYFDKVRYATPQEQQNVLWRRWPN